MRSAIAVAAALVTSVAAGIDAGLQSCAQACTDAHNKCVTGMDANLSYCASEYGKCLGYSPYKDGSLITPTACVSPTQTDTAGATATATTAASGTPTAPPQDDCSKVCWGAYSKCTTGPGAILSTCHSDYVDCLGNDPLEGGNETIIKSPGVCSNTTSSPAPPPDNHKDECPVKACTHKYDLCRGKPGANLSTCGSAYAACLGYSPFGANGTLIPPKECPPTQPGNNGTWPTLPPVIISGGGSVRPAGMAAVVIMGVAALL